MAEGGGLENRYRRKSIGGSNPSSSASVKIKLGVSMLKIRRALKEIMYLLTLCSPLEVVIWLGLVVWSTLAIYHFLKL